MELSVSKTSAILPEHAYVVGNIMITKDNIITDVSTILIYWLFASPNRPLSAFCLLKARITRTPSRDSRNRRLI